MNEEKKKFLSLMASNSISPDGDKDELKSFCSECPPTEKKFFKYVGCCDKSNSCCCKSNKCSRVLNRLFCPVSWPVLGLIALVASVIVITLEFAADTGFCFYNPVIPLTVSPISTPRGIDSFVPPSE